LHPSERARRKDDPAWAGGVGRREEREGWVRSWGGRPEDVGGQVNP
jgi:hypothetical protein